MVIGAHRCVRARHGQRAVAQVVRRSVAQLGIARRHDHRRPCGELVGTGSARRVRQGRRQRVVAQVVRRRVERLGIAGRRHRQHTGGRLVEPRAHRRLRPRHGQRDVAQVVDRDASHRAPARQGAEPADTIHHRPDGRRHDRRVCDLRHTRASRERRNAESAAAQRPGRWRLHDGQRHRRADATDGQPQWRRHQRRGGVLRALDQSQLQRLRRAPAESAFCGGGVDRERVDARATRSATCWASRT